MFIVREWHDLCENGRQVATASFPIYLLEDTVSVCILERGGLWSQNRLHGLILEIKDDDSDNESIKYFISEYFTDVYYLSHQYVII